MDIQREQTENVYGRDYRSGERTKEIEMSGMGGACRQCSTPLLRLPRSNVLTQPSAKSVRLLISGTSAAPKAPPPKHECRQHMWLYQQVRMCVNARLGPPSRRALLLHQHSALSRIPHLHISHSPFISLSFHSLLNLSNVSCVGGTAHAPSSSHSSLSAPSSIL